MLAEVRQAIAAAISASLPDVQANAYQLGNPTPPTIEVWPTRVEYDHAAQRGADEWGFTVRAYVAETTDIGAQMRLDKMLEPSGGESVKAAIEADVTLGGLVDYVHVTDNTGYQRFSTQTGGVLLGSDWNLTILASGG